MKWEEFLNNKEKEKEQQVKEKSNQYDCVKVLVDAIENDNISRETLKEMAAIMKPLLIK